MNHTPGPWAVSPTKHRTLIVSTQGFQVAAIDEASSADSALIAAAPELLAVLRRIEALEAGSDLWRIEYSRAIARATGEAED